MLIFPYFFVSSLYRPHDLFSTVISSLAIASILIVTIIGQHIRNKTLLEIIQHEAPEFYQKLKNKDVLLSESRKRLR